MPPWPLWVTRGGGLEAEESDEEGVLRELPDEQEVYRAHRWWPLAELLPTPALVPRFFFA